MPRVSGHLLSQSTHPCGRLYLQGDYDSQRQILEFCIDSKSRPDRVYGCELDCQTGELGCKCEALSDYRECSRMPYRVGAAGTYAEHLAKQKGKHLLPLITRQPRFLCPHGRAIRAFLKRRGLLPAFHQIEASLISRLEAMPDKVRAA